MQLPEAIFFKDGKMMSGLTNKTAIETKMERLPLEQPLLI
jgi:hypothetical protein